MDITCTLPQKNLCLSQGLVDVRVVMQSDKVLCPGSGVGMVVAGKTTEDQEYKYYPVCVPAFSAGELGQWSK